MSPSAVESSMADSQEKLLQDLKSTDVEPLWAKMTKLNPPQPEPKAVPHLWRYKDIKPNLIRAGNLVTEKQAERRVLMLINPKMEAPCTTDTLYAGLQLVMPNETAPAHRHTATAVRFIIEGQGGFTAVHGQRIAMQRGDVISTPQWMYHDHGKDGNGPMIWLDGLDLPQFQHYPVHFVQHYSESRYPAKDVSSAESPIVWPWREMKARLDAVGEAFISRDYRRDDGTHLSKVIGCSAERVEAGTSAPKRQETASIVYHVVEGAGQVHIGDQTLEFKQSDTFCVPSWATYEISSDASAGTLYLYRFDERPMLEALGFYRNSNFVTVPYNIQE